MFQEFSEHTLEEKANVDECQSVKKRLFFVHGPTQALNVMSIIHEEGSRDKPTCDFAILGGFGVQKQHDTEIIEATKNILQGHEWAYIKDITGDEGRINSPYYNRHYSKCFESIKEITGLSSVDELYMYSNSRGPLTIMLGRLYERAKIVIFGDGFGVINAAIGDGFSRIDEVRVILPIEQHKGFLNHIPCRIMKKETLINVIDRLISLDPKLDAALSELRQKAGTESILLTTGRLAERRTMDMEHEVCMYVKAIERSCEPGSAVFIKEHPREMRKDRVGLIDKRLTEKGYKCIAIDNETLRLTAAEIICRRVPFKKVICPASTSGIIVKYLYNCSVDFGVDSEDIANYKGGGFLRISIDGWKKALENIDTWDMKSPLYSFDLPPFNYMEYPVITEKKPKPIPTNEEALSWLSGYFLKGAGLGELFKERSIRKIAVYGIGVVGKIIAQSLSLDSEIELFLIDKNLAGFEYVSKKIYSPEQFGEYVDAVVIAVTRQRHVNEIKASLVRTKRVITLGDLLSYIE